MSDEPLEQSPPTVLEFFETARSSVVPCVLLLVVSIGVGFAVAFSLPTKYRAETIVRVSDTVGASLGGLGGAEIGGLASLVGIRIPTSGNPDALPLLASHAMAERFIVRYELQSALSEDPAHSTLWQTVRLFRRGVLQVAEDRRTGLITVSINWRDPVVAAKWANDFVAFANESLRERDRQEAEQSVAFLRKRLLSGAGVEMEKTLSRLLEVETRTLMLTDARREYAYTVIDRAVPPEIRSSPRRTLILMISAVLGAVLASALVMFRLHAARAK